MTGLPDCKELLLAQQDGVLYITLNRPQKRNAMNSALVAELIAVSDAVIDNRDVRALVLRGSEGNFCAGGDISGMKDSSDDGQGKDATWHFNRSFGHLIGKLNRQPQVVITLLEGAVLGGGFGLACVSDVSIADADAMFALPETGLGIIPAQIAPFVASRIGLTQARRLALLGERINGKQAVDIGIAHHLSHGADDMQAQLDQVLKLLKRCGPGANAITKQLLLDVNETLVIDSILDRAADDFTRAMLSDEGQEGTRAFVEKRKPDWAE